MSTALTTASACEDFPECNKFVGRKKLICRGEAGLPLKGEHSVNSYRKAWGLPPIIASAQVSSLVPSRASIRAKMVGGVGTELKKLLSWFGQYPVGDCQCVKHALHMDIHGIKWCQDNVDKVVGWLSEEARKKSVLGWTLDKVPGFEWTAKQLVLKAIENAKAERAKIAPEVKKVERPFTYKGIVPRWISTAQLMQDAHTLASMLPANTPFIIGIARSGLCVSTMVAMLLHLPLKVFRQSTYDLIDGGNGWRLTGNTGGHGAPVVIDDTVMTGNSFRYSMPVIRKIYPNALSAAVYVNPSARLKPDIWAVDLPWPHILEWNIFNSVLSPHLAYDFDGILCHDCPAGYDDDGPKYAEFLRDTKPLYLCRKTAIPLIVTARLEKYRPQTLEWLAKHGIAVNELIMGPWANNHARARGDVAGYKAKHFVEFLKRRHAIKPPMFVESEPAQAKRIADLSGGLVVCPAANRVFP